MLPGDVHHDSGAGLPMFRAYGDGFLQVGDERFTSGLLIHQGAITAPWGPEDINSLQVHDLQQVLDDPPEVLLIGTGRTTAFPMPEIMDALNGSRIGFECMDSRAAARTYNILAGEGRDVSAAMLLPQV